MVLICIIVALTCAIGWLTCWAAAAGLVKYLKNKGYAPPSVSEMKACIREVIQEKFGLK